VLIIIIVIGGKNSAEMLSCIFLLLLWQITTCSLEASVAKILVVILQNLWMNIEPLLQFAWYSLFLQDDK
jgi:hypothetical protein